MRLRCPGLCTRSRARRERAGPPRICAAGRTFPRRALCKGFADVAWRGNSLGHEPRNGTEWTMMPAYLRRQHYFPDPSAGKRGRRRPLGFPCRALTGAGSPPAGPRQMRVFALKWTFLTRASLLRGRPAFAGEPDGSIGELVAAEEASARGIARALALSRRRSRHVGPQPRPHAPHPAH